jgi:hypothetical protein
MSDLDSYENHSGASDNALMNPGTPPAMKIGSDRSMITLFSVTEGRSRPGALNPE